MKDAVVAADRVAFLTRAERVPREVSGPILASWRRSLAHHVAADRVTPPYVEELALDTALTRAAAPAIAGLRAAVDGEPMSILLTDHTGLVLVRVTDDRALDRRLDRAMLAPGFQYAESAVGTNGIGTCLEIGGPAHVQGHEHFAESLEDLACAAVPVTHPITGRTVGVVNLTTWRRNAGSLLMTVARTTAEQVRVALLDQADQRSRALFAEHLRTHHRFPGAVVAVNDEISLLNDAAREALAAEDRALLVEHALAVAAAGRDHDVDLRLADGCAAVLHCRLVQDPGGGGHAGVVATLVRHRVPRSVPATPATAGGGRYAGTWQALEREAIVRALDEAGGDKAVAARALGMSRATVYRRIRSHRIT